MKYCIDEKVVNKMGLTLPELFAALLVKTNNSIQNIVNKLLEKEVIVKTDCGYSITQHWNDVIENILLTSDKTVPTDDELVELANNLRMKFPGGKKPDSPYYYRCNQREVLLKLKKFFKLYGNKWSAEEILAATDKYVENTRGTKVMRLSKYFILKENTQEGEISELASILENMSNDDKEDSNWINELR